MPTTSSMLKVGLFLQKHCQQEELNFRNNPTVSNHSGFKNGHPLLPKPQKLSPALLCFEDAYNSPKSPPTHQNLFQLFNTCI